MQTEALPPGSAMYHALLEHATDLVAILEADGSIRYTSPSFHRILGYTADEILGTDAFSYVHPEDRRLVQAAFIAAVEAGGTPLKMQYRWLHADGSYRVIESTGSSHLNDPLMRGFIVNSRDITERVQAEEQVKEKNAQYRSIFEATSDGLGITDLNGIIVEANHAFCRMLGYRYEEVLGLHGTVVVHPDYHPVFADYLRTVGEGGTYQTRGMMLRKDGSPVSIEVHGSSFIYKGAPHVLGVIRDVTEREQAYDLLEQRVVERTRELSALLDVSHNLTATLELQPLLGLILEGLKVVAEYSGASLLTRDGEDFMVIATRGPSPEEHVLHRRFSAAHGRPIWDRIIRKEAVILDDVRDDSLLACAYREAVGNLLETTFSYIRSWLGVPLTLKDQVIGMLSIAHHEPRSYTPRHVPLALAIASQAAVAIENARLYEQAQRIAALEERQRLARELHDSVSQALYGIALGARTARTLLDRDVSKVGMPLDYVLSLAEAGLAEMRALIFELRPETLEQEGLVTALEKQATAARARHGITIDLELCPEPEVSFSAKEAAYRIAQEALHNTIKHAQATRAVLRLTCTALELALEVQDNGTGFNPQGEFHGHLGLSSMRERALRVGGTLLVESTPSQGTCVRMRIPARSSL